MFWGAFTVYAFTIVSYVLQLVLRFFPSFLPMHPSIFMYVQNFVEKIGQRRFQESILGG